MQPPSSIPATLIPCFRHVLYKLSCIIPCLRHVLLIRMVGPRLPGVGWEGCALFQYRLRNLVLALAPSLQASGLCGYRGAMQLIRQLVSYDLARRSVDTSIVPSQCLQFPIMFSSEASWKRYLPENRYELLTKRRGRKGYS